MPYSREEIKKLFDARKSVGQQKFADIVEIDCGYKIIPINLSDASDKKLIELITKALTNFITKANRTETRYKGNRVNDVGKRMEEALVEEMRKYDLNPTQLGSSGYPDLFLEVDGKKVYVELKTSAQKKKEKTNYRLFYFSSGKKIKTDAHHLLLQIQILEEQSKIWKVESWQLRDLVDFKVVLKTEWNANFQDVQQTTKLLKEG